MASAMGELKMGRVAEMLEDINKTTETLRREYSQQMEAWKAFTDQVRAEGALSKKVKGFIALALAIARGCDSCIAYHTNAALELGATREEILEICLVSLYMCGAPATPPTGLVLEALEKFQSPEA
jgi:AhpD family alkylhydroperoxidase